MVAMRALIDRARYFDRVEAFYSTFSHDLTASYEKILIEPAKIDRISVQSINGILDALIAFGQRGEKSFLIATHGNPNGLPVRIRAACPVTMNHDIMDYLRAALTGTDSARDDLLNITSIAGGKVFQNAGQLDTLLGKLRQVRQLRLEHLEFRGCNIGAGPALRAIHRLFGARITDGPTVQFIWTNLTTAHIRNRTEAQFRSELQSLGPSRRAFSDSEIYRGGTNPDSADPVVAIGIRGTGISIEARSRDMVVGFVEAYLQDPILFILGRPPAGRGYRPGHRLPIVGFLTPNGPKPFVIPGDGFDYTAYIEREMDPAPITFP